MEVAEFKNQPQRRVSLEQSESDVGAKRGKTRVNYVMIALIGQKKKNRIIAVIGWVSCTEFIGFSVVANRRNQTQLQKKES